MHHEITQLYFDVQETLNEFKQKINLAVEEGDYHLAHLLHEESEYIRNWERHLGNLIQPEIKIKESLQHHLDFLEKRYEASLINPDSDYIQLKILQRQIERVKSEVSKIEIPKTKVVIDGDVLLKYLDNLINTKCQKIELVLEKTLTIQITKSDHKEVKINLLFDRYKEVRILQNISTFINTSDIILNDKSNFAFRYKYSIPYDILILLSGCLSFYFPDPKYSDQKFIKLKIYF